MDLCNAVPMKRPLRSAALGLALALSGPAASFAEAPEILTIAAPWHVMSRDPSVSGDGFQRMQVAETLVDADTEGRLRPGLATDWRVSGDGLEWRFTLREDVLFHDGTPLTADAAIAALDRAASRPGVLDKAPISAIRAATDDIAITLSEPFAALPALLAHSSAIILAQSSFDAEGAPQDVVGTGPYRVTAIVPPQTMELARFDDYWGPKPAFAEVRFLSASRAETRALMAESGDAQLVYTLDPPSFSRLARLDGIVTEARSIPRVTLLKVNAGHPFLSDPRARRALSLAIDRNGIAKGILRFPRGGASQLFPPAMAGWHDPDLDPLAHDPQAARAILADLGWTEGADGILMRDGARFELSLRTYPDRAELPIIAAALQEQLRRIGVALDISVANHSEIPAGHHDGSLELALHARNYGLSTDPIGAVFLDFAKGGGDWGAMGWSRDDVDAAIAGLATTADPDARAPHLAVLSAALQEDLPVIPIAWYRGTLAHDARLQNVILDPFERSYGVAGLAWTD